MLTRSATALAVAIGLCVSATPSSSADTPPNDVIDCPPGTTWNGTFCEQNDPGDEDVDTGCTQHNPYVPNAPCHFDGATFSPEHDRYLSPVDPQLNERFRPPDGDLAHTGTWEGDPDEGWIYEWFKISGVVGGISLSGRGYMWLASGPGEPDPVDPEELARTVLDGMNLEPISIGMAPKPTEQVPDSMGLVGAPNWMWAQNPGPTTWGPTTDTGSEGAVTVTVTAQVDEAVWDLGDGTSVTCTTPGDPYDTSFGVRESPSCGHTYQQTSRDQPNQAYTVSATTHWTAEWEASTGAAGTLEVDPLTSTAHVRIGERQLIEQ